MQIGSSLGYTRDYNQSTLFLNSADKTPGSPSQTNFSISYASQGRALQQIKQLSFTRFSTNNLYNNIASYNNTLGLYYQQQEPPGPSVPAYAIVPPGYYTATMLAATIQETVRANFVDLNNFTCVFNTTTYKFTLGSGNPNLALLIAPVVLSGGFTPRLEGALAYLMGFTSLPTAENSTITANTLPQLNIQNIYIYSSKLAPVRSYRSTNQQTSNQSNLLLSVSLATTGYGATVSYEKIGGDNGRTETFYSIENSMDLCDFRLCDQYGNILECPPNNNSYFEFVAHY
jgi:hypothetical protein